MKLGEQNQRSNSYHLGPITILGVGITSLIYFADIGLRASQKCFWFDEMFTVYLSRLPTFGATYAAAAHGADFNPPLVYLLTRASERLFGEGLIATRLPEMIGVWLFCVCLFLFVSRRTGPLAGFVAGALPFFTLVQYYAYEARAHGLALGWCGLMLVFWQRTKERRRRELWLTLFGLSLVGALLTHVYAVYLIFPFVVVELWEFLRNRSADWGTLAAAFLPLLVVVPVYLPLFRAFRKIAPKVLFPAAHDAIGVFFISMFGPAGLVILLAIALIVLCRKRIVKDSPASGPSPQEIVLAVAFAVLPVVGWLGSVASHGPFIDRYFVSSVAGYGILLATAISQPQIETWAARTLAGTMLFLMLLDLAMAAHERIRSNFILHEPSTGLLLSTTPKDPMALYSTLTGADPGLDILVLPGFEYLYFFNYAPPNVASRLYYAESADDSFSLGFAKLQEWAHVDLKMAEIKPFLATHSRFLLYESNSNLGFVPVSVFLDAGYRVKSIETDAAGGTLLEFER